MKMRTNLDLLKVSSHSTTTTIGTTSTTTTTNARSSGEDCPDRQRKSPRRRRIVRDFITRFAAVKRESSPPDPSDKHRCQSANCDVKSNKSVVDLNCDQTEIKQKDEDTSEENNQKVEAKTSSSAAPQKDINRTIEPLLNNIDNDKDLTVISCGKHISDHTTNCDNRNRISATPNLPSDSENLSDKLVIKLESNEFEDERINAFAKIEKNCAKRRSSHETRSDNNEMDKFGRQKKRRKDNEEEKEKKEEEETNRNDLLSSGIACVPEYHRQLIRRQAMHMVKRKRSHRRKDPKPENDPKSQIIETENDPQPQSSSIEQTTPTTDTTTTELMLSSSSSNNNSSGDDDDSSSSSSSGSIRSESGSDYRDSSPERFRPGAGGGGEEEKKKIFIGGLSFDTSEKDLEEYFARFGKISMVNLKYDVTTGLSRRFAFVSFAAESTVDEVMRKPMHRINGRYVEAKRARVRPVFKKVFVGGIDDTITEADIHKYFARFGKVSEIDFPLDRTRHARKNYCFVFFADEFAAEEASLWSRQVIKNCIVDVHKSLAPEERSQHRQLAAAAAGINLAKCNQKFAKMISSARLLNSTDLPLDSFAKMSAAVVCDNNNLPANRSRSQLQLSLASNGAVIPARDPIQPFANYFPQNGQILPGPAAAPYLPPCYPTSDGSSSSSSSSGGSSGQLYHYPMQAAGNLNYQSFTTAGANQSIAQLYNQIGNKPIYPSAAAVASNYCYAYPYNNYYYYSTSPSPSSSSPSLPSQYSSTINSQSYGQNNSTAATAAAAAAAAAALATYSQYACANQRKSSSSSTNFATISNSSYLRNGPGPTINTSTTTTTTTTTTTPSTTTTIENVDNDHQLSATTRLMTAEAYYAYCASLKNAPPPPPPPPPASPPTESRTAETSGGSKSSSSSSGGDVMHDDDDNANQNERCETITNKSNAEQHKSCEIEPESEAIPRTAITPIRDNEDTAIDFDDCDNSKHTISICAIKHVDRRLSGTAAAAAEEDNDERRAATKTTTTTATVATTTTKTTTNDENEKANESSDAALISADVVAEAFAASCASISAPAFAYCDNVH